MHSGNGIICPVTGISIMAVALGTAFYAYKKARKDFSKDKIFPAVALTTLVFALQMINFAIPITGSSGHIVGGSPFSNTFRAVSGIFINVCNYNYSSVIFCRRRFNGIRL